ncbi:MAG: radical SAM protein [Salinarimonas sp.]
MKLTLNPSHLPGRAFDRQIPVFNIYYPFQWDANSGDVFVDGISALSEIDLSEIDSVALYFHFPFCETICNFCPFTRGKYQGHQIISDYLAALIKEIKLKSERINLQDLKVRSIFVGGGTPSLLMADEICRFGAALHEHFDLSLLREFAFECEVKSVTADKVAALRDIGVTNARYGLQTFDPFWRNMFDLTASLDQIQAANELFNKMLPYSSFDILYGMNGQTTDAFLADLDKAAAMGNALVDVYPIDNVVTQIKLHKKLEAAGFTSKTADERFDMNRLLRSVMREHGFLPHNGHGYVRVDADELARDPIVTDTYTFDYHDHIYGHADTAVVGFGVNAISILPQTVLKNTGNRRKYIVDMHENGSVQAQISRHDRAIDASRPVVTRLAYHGILEKDRVRWNEVPRECILALHEFADAGLIQDFGDSWRITRSGWEWYVNMIYYAMPESQKAILDAFIIHCLQQPGRVLTADQIEFVNSDHLVTAR